MSPDPGSSRQYTETEMREIFKRALERQESGRSSVSVREEKEAGFSLQEMEQIAAEVGLAPDHLRAAAAEVDLEQTTEKRFYFAGGPDWVDWERVVEGPVSEEAWEEMVREIHRCLGLGNPSPFGPVLEWTSSDTIQPTRVALTSRQGRIRITLRSQWGAGAAAFFVPALFIGVFAVGFMGAFAPLTPWLKVLAGGGIIGGLFGTARSLFGAWSRRHQRKLKRLLDRLEGLATSSATTPVKTRMKAPELDSEVLSESNSTP